MKKLTITLALLFALGAGLAGSLLKDMLLDAPVVQAQAQPLKVAVIDLETVARASALFAKNKDEWLLQQEKIKGDQEKLRTELAEARGRLRRASEDGARRADDLSALRAEVAALEEYLEGAVNRQRAILAELRETYQGEVLRHVVDVARNYAIKEGYHMVLQIYSEPNADSELIDAALYSERLLGTAVLLHPGTVAKTNPYVTDITAQISDLVRAK